MSSFEAFFLSIPVWFTMEANMIVTKIAGIACSFADIGFIFVLLKTAHALKPNTPAPKWRFRILCFFAVLTPTLLLPIDGDFFLVWQSAVLGLPYLILAYTAVKEAPTIMRHMKSVISPRLDRSDRASNDRPA